MADAIVEELEHKYEISVEKRERAKRLDDDTKAALREAGMLNEKNKIKISGVSPKMLRGMKLEYVNCPVMEREVHFVQCFVCPNFQSRLNSKVLCRGDALK